MNLSWPVVAGGNCTSQSEIAPLALLGVVSDQGDARSDQFMQHPVQRGAQAVAYAA